MRKVVIIGAGHVGSHCGYALAHSGIAGEIVLVDVDKDKAHAQALDIADSVSSVSYTHLRAHETRSNLVCRLLLEKIFFNDTATTEIYTRKIVGSVRCV